MTTTTPFAANVSSTARLARAIAFAAEKHRGQVRKGVLETPYINHPIAVLNVLLVEAGIEDPLALQAAALHDTVEDTGTTREELVEHFGADVADVVVEVTDDKSLPKAERKRLQVEHAPHKSRPAALVKIADKICNLRDIACDPPVHWSVERRREYFDWSRRVVDALPPTSDALMRLFIRAQGGRP